MAVVTMPTAIPAKAVCRKLKITQQQVAFVSERSPAQVNLVLNGWKRDDAVEDAVVTLVGKNATHSELFGAES
jgi:hypothetical protein